MVPPMFYYQNSTEFRLKLFSRPIFTHFDQRRIRGDVIIKKAQKFQTMSELGLTPPPPHWALEPREVILKSQIWKI